MRVSSDSVSTAEEVASVSTAGDRRHLERRYLEDEEFPGDLPVSYDWMLQSGALRTARDVLGLVIIAMAALLVTVSIFVLYRLPKFFPFSDPTSLK